MTRLMKLRSLAGRIGLIVAVTTLVSLAGAQTAEANYPSYPPVTVVTICCPDWFSQPSPLGPDYRQPAATVTIMGGWVGSIDDRGCTSYWRDANGYYVRYCSYAGSLNICGGVQSAPTYEVRFYERWTGTKWSPWQTWRYCRPWGWRSDYNTNVLY